MPARLVKKHAADFPSQNHRHFACRTIICRQHFHRLAHGFLRGLVQIGFINHFKTLQHSLRPEVFKTAAAVLNLDTETEPGSDTPVFRQQTVAVGNEYFLNLTALSDVYPGNFTGRGITVIGKLFKQRRLFFRWHGHRTYLNFMPVFNILPNQIHRVNQLFAVDGDRSRCRRFHQSRFAEIVCIGIAAEIILKNPYSGTQPQP